MEQKQTCRDLAPTRLRERMKDITRLWESYKEDPEAEVEGLDLWDEYGLSLTAKVDEQTRETFLCFLLGTGGPHDEIKFYVSSLGECYRLTYLYADWFDCYELEVADTGHKGTLLDIFEDWRESGTVDHLIKELRKELRK